MTQPYYGMRLRLEGKSERYPNWGTFSTVTVQQINIKDTEDKAYDRAKASLEHYANQWVANYDPLAVFRVVGS